MGALTETPASSGIADRFRSFQENRHALYTKLPLHVFFALWLCGFSETAHAADRPNVVLIMADDMGYECVTANGGESHRTPHIAL